MFRRWIAIIIIMAGALGARESARAQTEEKKPALDELVYHDGDRVRGHLIEQSGDVLVFRSERFGLLHVPVAEAKVIVAEQSPKVAKQQPEPPGVTKSEAAAGESVAVAPAPFSPRALALLLGRYFGAWHGRFSFSGDMLSDTSDRETVTIESKLERKWTRDEVQLTGRYDFGSVDDARTTDILKADGSYRHDFPRHLFFTYRPTLEWNRNYFVDYQPADYVLLQQELGMGVNLVNTEAHKVRTGISENIFDVWQISQNQHHEQPIESVFGEWEAKLPWRVTLTDRGVYYYSLAKGTSGWENRFEINKKLTETMTVGVRHELRYNDPDLRSSDYHLLRLMLGFDF